LAGLRQVATRCKFRGRRGSLWDVLKIDGSLARNIDFEVANLKKTRGKTSILRLQSVKIGGSRARNACVDAPTCLESLVFLWPRRVYGGSCKTSPFRRFPTVKIGGRLARNVRFAAPTCLVWLRRVYGGSCITSPFRRPPTVKIGGRLARNVRFDAPTCLVSSLWFSFRRRVYGGSCKNSPFWRFPSRLSCRFAWQAWHFVTFQPVLYRVESVKIGGSLAWNARFAVPTCLVSSLLVFLWPRRVYGGSCKTSPFQRFPSRLSCRLPRRRGTLWHSNLFYTVSKMSKLEFGGSLAWNARFAVPTCLVSSLWFSCGLAVFMGEAQKHLLFKGFQAGCHVVLPGRRGNLWHSNLFYSLHTQHSTLPTPHFTRTEMKIKTLQRNVNRNAREMARPRKEMFLYVCIIFFQYSHI